MVYQVPRVPDNSWGEAKQAKQLLLTPSAVEMIDRRCAELGLSRSEYMERVVRWIDAHWDGQLQRDLGLEGSDRHAE